MKLELKGIQVNTSNPVEMRKKLLELLAEQGLSDLFEPVKNSLFTAMFRLIGTEYYFGLSSSLCFRFFRLQSGWKNVSFQEILESVPKEISDRLLFHLDLFI